MNRYLGLTMRVVETQYSTGNIEVRDALAHDWSAFLHRALPETPWVPLPNAEDDTMRLISAFKINGLVLTGGDDWGKTPARDATESLLLEWARECRIPVLGVCRGAQVINRFLGGALRPVPAHHVATRHAISWQSETLEINSYHQQGIFAADLATNLHTLASAEDGSIEAFRHAGLPWYGVMWHPEREPQCAQFDIQLFKNLFMETA